MRVIFSVHLVQYFHPECLFFRGHRVCVCVCVCSCVSRALDGSAE